MRNKFTSKRVGIIIASATTALILALLFMLPSSVFGMDVTLTPTKGDGATYELGDTIVFDGEIVLGDGEFQGFQFLKAEIDGPQPTTITFPVAEGTHLIDVDPGRALVAVVHENVTFDPHGYGYGFEGDSPSGGRILITITYLPPSHVMFAGHYSAQLNVGGIGQSASTKYQIEKPPPPATPVPEEDQVIIDPGPDGGATVFEMGETGRVTTPDQEINLEIPPGFLDVAIPVQVVVEQIDIAEAPDPPPGRRVLRALSIDVYDMLGNQYAIFSGMPASLQVSYTDADLASVGGDPSRLVIMRYVADLGWRELRTTVDEEKKLLITDLTTFSVFAVGAEITVGDINSDGSVNYLDLAMFASAYGSSQNDAQYIRAADLNSDGHVNHLDLGILATNYGS